MLTVLEIVAALGLGFWVALSLDRRRSWPGEFFLRRETRLAGTLPEVAVIVPARNEAALLPRTLGSLLAQEAPGVQVLLVDDQSDDGTAEVARALYERRLRGSAFIEGETSAPASRAGASLRIVQPGPRPSGWSGKVHALARGVEALGESAGPPPEWLLFTDADIRHPPDSLRLLLARARQGPYDVVSVMARLNAESFWERLLIPPFIYFFHLLYPFRLVARPGGRVAAAAGGCVLVRRSLLEAAGGLEAIRGAVIDDVALARVLKGAGARLWLGFCLEITSVRPYRGVAELWQMVSRSAFVQLRYRFDLLFLVLVGLGTLFVAPPLVASWAAMNLVLTLGGQDPAAGGEAWSPARILLWSTLAWGLQSLAVLPFVRHQQVPRRFAPLLPLASLAYALMTLSSAWNHLAGSGSRWKGRSYRQ